MRGVLPAAEEAEAPAPAEEVHAFEQLEALTLELQRCAGSHTQRVRPDA